MSDIAMVVGEEAEHLWMTLKTKIYYKDSKPYGILGLAIEDTMIVIYSMAINNGDFTVAMIRDIIKLYNDYNITLITDDNGSFDKIKNVLEKYGFYFFTVDTDSGKTFMYSLHYKI